MRDSSSPTSNASIAASGFALSSYCIAADRGWVSRDQAKERARNTLDFFANRSFHDRGWFYHFVDYNTGERRFNSEISTIDTAAVRNLLGGATVASMSRSPDIMADAAHAIFMRPSRQATGNFYIDEEVLRAEGMTDFSVYAPGAADQLAGDFFVPDEVFANSQTKVKRIY